MTGIPYEILMSSKKKERKEESNTPAMRALAVYAKQFLLPIDAPSPVVVSPSGYPNQVCARHIHKIVDVSSATSAYANGFTIVMSPNLYNPGFISASTNSAIPASAGVVSISGSVYTNNRLAGSMRAHPLKITDTEGNANLIVPKDVADSTGSVKSAIEFMPGNCEVFFSLTNKENYSVRFQIYSAIVSGPWSLGPDVVLGPNATVTGAFTLSSLTQYIAFTGVDTFVHAHLNLSFMSMQVYASEPETFAPAFEKFIIDDNISHGRVVSMSILATNTSPEIANGGNINVGRVPSNFSPHGSISASLSNLPENRRYQGPASQGGYVFWMPSQFDEFEVDTIDRVHTNLMDADFLVLQVSGWNPPVGTTASFRIHFDWIVEFYTPNQLFEKVLTPPITTEFRDLYHAMLQMPAATCNPGHFDLLKKGLKEGLGFVKEGQKWYGKNQAVVNLVLSLLAKMLI